MFSTQSLWAFTHHIETMLAAHCFWAFSYISNFYIYLFSFLPCMMLSDCSVPLVTFFALVICTILT